MKELTANIEKEIEDRANALLEGHDHETIKAYIKALKAAYVNSSLEIKEEE